MQSGERLSPIPLGQSALAAHGPMLRETHPASRLRPRTRVFHQRLGEREESRFSSRPNLSGAVQVLFMMRLYSNNWDMKNPDEC
jgi:hypothetical protein